MLVWEQNNFQALKWNTIWPPTHELKANNAVFEFKLTLNVLPALRPTSNGPQGVVFAFDDRKIDIAVSEKGPFCGSGFVGIEACFGRNEMTFTLG